jgi:uncharacterized protein (TIGR02611 family)
MWSDAVRLTERLGGFRQRVRSTRTGRLTLQLVIGIIGAAVVALGLVLIPFPGPGWLVVLAGLAILSLEFVWAERLLAFTRGQLERWWHWLGRQHMIVRLLAGLVGLAFVGTVVALSLWFSFGINVLDYLPG